MALIDPEGLFFGERMRKCSDKSRLLWPYLFVAANTAGRLRLSYEDLLDKVFVGFRNPPTQQEITEAISDYRRNFLAYPYQSGGEFWLQFYRKSGFTPRYEKAKDQKTAPPPAAYWEWINSYKKPNSLLSTLFTSSENCEKFAIGIGIGVGTGIGIGIGKEQPPLVESHDSTGAEFELQPPSQNGKPKAKQKQHSVEDQIAEAVFAYYLKTMNIDGRLYHLTDKRRTHLKARAREALQGARTFQPEEDDQTIKQLAIDLMCACCEAIKTSPHHRGENAQGEIYMDIKHLFGSTETMERWINRKRKATTA